MYGQITKYHDDLGVGVIEGEDGNKYRFAKSELVNKADRLIGESVDFIVHARCPKQIIMMTGSIWTAFGDLVGRAANDRE